MKKIILLVVLFFFLFPSIVKSESFEASKKVDNKITLEEIKARADKGEAEYQVKLGNIYKEGKGVPQDYSQALKWYHEAARQGNAESQFMIGVMYHFGKGVPQDYKEVFKWY